jgi:hypothetical protein
MVFSLEHDIKVTKNHQNLLPTQSVLVAHTVVCSLFNEFVCKLGLFWHEWASLKRSLAQFTHERVECDVFLCDESHKGSKSLKIFKISLTFRFDKL